MLRKLRNRVKHTVSTLKRQILPGAVVLMYHRVAEADSDPWSLCVTPRHFAEHLDVLRELGHPLPLQQLTTKLRDHQPIHRSIAVTFDDGYVDNLQNAKPLLEKYDIPATVFITTGGIGQTREFWWDELDRLLLQQGVLPGNLQLTIQGKPHQWNLAEATHYSEADRDRHRNWRMEQVEDPTPRHSLYRELYEILRFLSRAEHIQLLDQICNWANTTSAGRPSHRSLTPNEMLELAAGGLVEIGAHSITHPFLADLPIDSQRHEIQQSKETLEDVLGYPIASFSYPNGSHTHDSIAILQETGFSSACCSIDALVQPHTNLFLVPRVVVPDWDGETFARWLSQYF